MESKIIAHIQSAIKQKISQYLSQWNPTSAKQRLAVANVLQQVLAFKIDHYHQAQATLLRQGFVHPTQLDEQYFGALMDKLPSLDEINKYSWKLLAQKPYHEIKELFGTMYQKLYLRLVTKEYLKLLMKSKQRAISNVRSNLSHVTQIHNWIQQSALTGDGFWNLPLGDLYTKDPRFVRELLSLVKEFAFAKELIEILGKSASVKQSYEATLMQEKLQQRGRMKQYCSTQFQGITTGNAIHDLLPHILSYRRHDLMRKLFKKQFVEKQLMQFEKAIFAHPDETIAMKQRMQQQNKKGPFLLVLDTSGSMSGKNERIAKAFAIAIMNVVAKEKRPCLVVGFGAAVQILDADDIKKDWNIFWEFLAKRSAGGTDLDEAMEAVLDALQKENLQKADVLLISDLQVSELAPQIQTNIAAQKQTGTKFYALALGTEWQPHQVAFLDRNWVYDYTPQAIERIMLDINTLHK